MPNGVAGNPVHWVYAIPSDGADNLAGLASVMQTDAEQIDAWWRGQDPTRAPRNDVAAFSCGAQLDITTVRRRATSAQLAPLPGRFSAIVDGLDAGGPRLAAHEVRRLLRRSDRGHERVRPGRERLDGLRRRRRLLPSRAWASRRRPSSRTRCCTRSARSRGTRRTTATARSSGHTCDDRDRSHVPVDRRRAAVRRSSSIPGATTTTATPAAGRTRRTRRGSSASTARRRSR